MSSIPPTPEAPPPVSTPTAAAPAAAPAAADVRRRRGLAWWLFALALLAALSAAGMRLVQLQKEYDALVARMLKLEADLSTTSGGYERELQATRTEVQKLAAETERLRSQRAELDQLYLDLTRGRDEAAVIEVERLINMAAQELQVGSLATAMAALQAADARLARIDRPQVVGLRRALAHDLERLRSAPAVDITGLALKLDQLMNAVDGWPLLAEPVRRPAEAKRAPTPAAAAAPAPAPAEASGWWPRLSRWLNAEFGDLVRIREVETPEALLLNDAQQRLARQQMRLRLLNARQSLLLRNDKLYRADLAEAQSLLARYFDLRQTGVSAAAAQLKTMAQAPLSVEVPQITDTVNALRTLRQGR